MDYKKKIAWLIAISTLIRLFIASTTELGNTEAYYWALSTKLQWNYFDHPPIVAWLIRATTANLLLHNELFVRLGAVVASAICTWLIYKLGSMIHSQQAGWFAAFLYATSSYASVGIGIYILPDSPQMVFWLSSLVVFIKVMDTGITDPRYRLWWCLFGIMTGLCIMSKVHGAFIWIGAVAYILAYDRQRLKSHHIYLALAITLIIISPIIVWNFEHNFISYKFHSGRVNIAHGGVDLLAFAKRLIEVIFSTGPFHYILIVISIYWVFKGKLTLDKNAGRILLFCNLPLILLLLIISLFRETLPHWPGPPLSALLVLPAVWLTSRAKAIAGKLPVVLKLGLIYCIIIAVSSPLLINYLPGTISRVQDGMRIGTDDATVEMYGWDHAGMTFDSVYRSDVVRHLMDAQAPIIITNWVPASHIDFYIAGRTGQETYGLGNIDSLHQYYWMNAGKKPLKIGENAYYIIPSNNFDNATFDEVTNSFNSFTVDLMFSQYRSGAVCKRFYIFRLLGFKGSKYFK